MILLLVYSFNAQCSQPYTAPRILENQRFSTIRFCKHPHTIIEWVLFLVSFICLWFLVLAYCSCVCFVFLFLVSCFCLLCLVSCLCLPAKTLQLCNGPQYSMNEFGSRARVIQIVEFWVLKAAQDPVRKTAEDFWRICSHSSTGPCPWNCLWFLLNFESWKQHRTLSVKLLRILTDL